MAVSLSTPGNSEASYLDQARAELSTWPALAFTHITDGVAFTAADTRILLLTGRSTARLHLTGPVIERLDHFLRASGQVERFAERGWVTIHLETSTDLDLLLALVSVAIKANI